MQTRRVDIYRTPPDRALDNLDACSACSLSEGCSNPYDPSDCGLCFDEGERATRDRSASATLAAPEEAPMWIKHVAEHEAEGYVAKVYGSVNRRGGALDNITKVHSLNPNALRALMSFYNGVMHGDCSVSLRRREMIAVAVSRFNECHY